MFDMPILFTKNKKNSALCFQCVYDSPMKYDVLAVIDKDKRSKGEEMALRLVSESIPIIAKYGYSNLNLANLAKELKVDRTLLAYYFTNIENIFLMGFRFIAAQAQEYIADETAKVDLTKVLEVYGLSLIDFFTNRPVYLNIWGQFLLIQLTNPRAKEELDSALAVGRERVQKMLTLTKPHMSDAELVARATDLQAHVFGPLFFHLIYEPFEATQVRDLWKDTINRL